MPSIHFHTEEVSLSLPDLSSTKGWLTAVINRENKSLGDINCILCNDEYLLKINQEYLSHDTYTDIVTFNYVENNCISGDLFISVDRVKENAEKFNVSFQKELNRVLVHGILHLIGYNDKTPEEAGVIRAKEDFYLTLLSEK